MFKRIILFTLMNVAVIAMASIIFSIFKIDPTMVQNQTGLNYQSLLIISLIYGFLGSFISLLMSKWLAKLMTGAVVITNPVNEEQRNLISMVERCALTARIPMPEVAIFHGTPNAFATGPSKSSSLVAVSDGLLTLMDKKELEAVISHEISHIKNGDMVTMTLLQGVLNAFVIFISRIIAFFVDKAIRGKDDRGGRSFLYPIIVILLQIGLGILSSIVLMAYSRKREYAADSGAAEIMGEPLSMVKALEKLDSQKEVKSSLPKEMAAFGIAGENKNTSLLDLFRSHPKIEDRINALKNGR